MNGSYGYPGNFLAELDRLQQYLDQTFRPASAPTAIRAAARGAFPAINIGSTPETVEVVAFAPGIDAGALQITIDKGLLSISGERKTQIPEKNDRSTVYAHERFSGAFRRVVSLPEDADPAKVDATYRDGLLRVTVAKREASKPRHISVK